MDRTRSGARGALALAALLSVMPAAAAGPGWGYAEVARSWGTPQVDESGKGTAAHLRVPVGEQYFLAADAERLDAHYSGRYETERFELASVGVGIHTVERSVHLFGEIHYTQKWRAQRTSSGEVHEPASGPGLAAGARWMATPWLLIEGQYGLKGYVVDGFTKADVGLRLLPHVWLVGTFNHGPFSGNEFCAGLRWAWDEYSYAQLPGARVASAPQGAALVPGESLVALRALVPQAKPLAGAAELAAIPAGATLELQESADNRFGTWWRVTAGSQSGWIREAELLGVP